MSTITVTSDEATASNTISITHNSPVSRVLRNDANGIAEVRTLAGQLPTPASGTLILTDYEASAGTSNYTAYVDEYVTRTNYVTNPRPNSLTGYSSSYTTGSGTWTHVSASPNSYNRMTKDASTSTTGFYINDATVPLTVGTVVSGRVMVRSSVATTVTPRNSTTVMAGQPPVAVEANVWTEVTFENYAITLSSFRLGLLVSSFPGGATFDIKWAMWEISPTLGTYFHGSMVDTEDIDYAWTGTANESVNTMTTHVTQVAASTTLVLDKPWLMVPVMPNFSEQVPSITNYGSQRVSQSTVHTVVGRPSPLVSLGPLGLRTGELEMFFPTLSEARKVETVFTLGQTTLLKQNVEGLDMYFIALSTSVAPHEPLGEEKTRYVLTAEYLEVTPPIGSLAGALGWDFNAVAAAYSSFNALALAFATFDDLTIQKEL